MQQRRAVRDAVKAFYVKLLGRDWGFSTAVVEPKPPLRLDRRQLVWKTWILS